ncbi:MAG TPA: ATP-binding cassette domain-containing protein [Gemmatimonadales bacterium]|jgi:phospholipid/cholesterol/gamma-HCH transport system ATP-binding protein|nr:ATP-binding cassette domain-containing protein [Gemmatimonadales bacterium]
MIRLERVHKWFGRHEVLRGVNLSIRAGSTLALLGPSGVGKSVLLKTVIGLLEPDEGEIWVGEVELTGAPERVADAVRCEMGYVFQYSALFDSLTVAENILLGLDERRWPANSPATRARLQECLGWVNLSPEIASRYPAELSGGMQKRVAIARAIVAEQRYILYDEPTAGLDPVNVEKIAGLIRRLQGDRGVTSIVVTHDFELAKHVGDEVAILDGGRIVADVPALALEALDHPMVQAFRHRPERVDVAV